MIQIGTIRIRAYRKRATKTGVSIYPVVNLAPLQLFTGQRATLDGAAYTIGAVDIDKNRIGLIEANQTTNKEA